MTKVSENTEVSHNNSHWIRKTSLVTPRSEYAKTKSLICKISEEIEASTQKMSLDSRKHPFFLKKKAALYILKNPLKDKRKQHLKTVDRLKCSREQRRGATSTDEHQTTCGDPNEFLPLGDVTNG